MALLLVLGRAQRWFAPSELQILLPKPLLAQLLPVPAATPLPTVAAAGPSAVVAPAVSGVDVRAPVACADGWTREWPRSAELAPSLSVSAYIVDCASEKNFRGFH